MRYVLFVLMALAYTTAFSQTDAGYMIAMAKKAGIQRPVPQAFASRIVKRPIKMDSLSLAQFHRVYFNTMAAGTALWVGGSLLVLSHALIFVANPKANFAMLATLAAVGVTAWTAGGVVLPIGAWERHRYKKSLKIALAKEGL